MPYAQRRLGSGALALDTDMVTNTTTYPPTVYSWRLRTTSTMPYFNFSDDNFSSVVGNDNGHAFVDSVDRTQSKFLEVDAHQNAGWKWRMSQIFLGLSIFSNICTCFWVAFSPPGESDGVIKCPPWGPESDVPFRIWVRELYPWLNLIAGRYTPSNQAAAIQRGVTGAACQLLIRVPPQYIQNGAVF